MPTKLRKRKSPRTRTKAPGKARRAKQPTHLQLLGRRQKRFVIWAGKSSVEQLSDRFRRFLPRSELFWEAALKAKMSPGEYEARLLNRNKISSRIGGINRGAWARGAAARLPSPLNVR